MEKEAGFSGNVLIVEDESAIKNVCQRVFKDLGFNPDTAANGAVAQKMIADKSYALLLLDIKMPVMSGIELYRWLLKEWPQVARKVIFITGDTMNRETQIFLKENKIRYLPKPFSLAELKAKVEATLKEIKADV